MLRATLAERLGHITAAEAERREQEEFWAIERPMLQRRDQPLGADVETSVERALRRSGASGCSMLLRGLFREQPWRGSFCDLNSVLDAANGVERRCGGWPRYEHTLVLAPQVRAFVAAVAMCGEEMG